MGGRGVGEGALVGVFDGEAAPQDLDEHLPELSGGQVVQERVDDRAEVEEGVGHGVERHIAPEEMGGPAGLGQRRHHDPADLGGEPAEHQGGNNEPWKKSHVKISMMTKSQHPEEFLKAKSSQIWSLLLVFDRHNLGKVVDSVTLATSLL